jgi:hypothetical protein
MFVRFEVFTAVTMKNGVFWALQEPHGVTTQKTPFFSRMFVLFMCQIDIYQFIASLF